MGTSIAAVVEAVPASKALPTAKRQQRSAEYKRKIVEETLAPDASVARIARAHAVNANQVFQWRRWYRAGKLGSPIASAGRLLPVSVSEIPANESILPPAAEATASTSIGREPASRVAPGTIHLELRKARLRIEGNVDPAVLRLVLKSLLG